MTNSPSPDDTAISTRNVYGRHDVVRGKQGALLWPPSAECLNGLVLHVVNEVIPHRPTTAQSSGRASESVEWRHLGLSSASAERFAQALTTSLRAAWPAQQHLVPELTGVLMFKYSTLKKLVTFLHKNLLASSGAAEAAGTPALEAAAEVAPGAETPKVRCYVFPWPPGAGALRELVLRVVDDVMVSSSEAAPGATSSTSTAREGELEWRHLGLNSAQAERFAAAVVELLRATWPGHQDLVPELTGVLMFKYRTLTKLVAFLHKSLQASDATVDTFAPESAVDAPRSITSDSGVDGDAAAATIRHVVALGALCMTVRMMEISELRRWPGPFDWVFSDAAMVSHCLEDNFEAFLRPSEYVMYEASKAGHLTYSAMLERNIIFNHHNPVLPEDYEYLTRCVNSFRGLLKVHPSCTADVASQAGNSGKVLFLLFNLERRVPLDDGAVLALFRQLCARCLLDLELLVVKVVTRSEDSPVQRLLSHQHQLATSGARQGDLWVYELRCVGTHDGYRFSDAVDTDALRDLLLGISAPVGDAPLLGGPRVFELASQVQDGTATLGARRHGELGRRAKGADTRLKENSTASTRMERLNACLAEAQRLQDEAPGSLLLSAAVVRKLFRHIGRAEEAGQALLSADKNFGQHMSMKALGAALGCHPVYASAEGACLVWCPPASRALAALRALAAWSPSIPGLCGLLLLPRDSIDKLAESVEQRGDKLLVAPEHGHQREGAKLHVVYCIKGNTEVFRMNRPPANLVVKLPRTAEEYLAVGQQAPQRFEPVPRVPSA